jgi:anti-anti-sigma factor
VAEFSEEVHDGLCVIRVAGDIDLAAIDAFVEAVRSSLGRCEACKLDLGGVSFIDSSGLGTLVRLRKEADAQGTPLRLINVTETTARLLQLTGLTEVLDIRTSQD